MLVLLHAKCINRLCFLWLILGLLHASFGLESF